MKKLMILGFASALGMSAILRAPADAAAGAAAAPAEKKETIGDAAMAAIRAGQTNQEALDTVLAKFPEAKTTLSSINWYRNKLRKDGEPVKSARELSAATPKPEKEKGKGKGETKPAEAPAGEGEKDPLE